MKRSFTMAAALVVLSGCANPGIVPMSEDTFMLSKTDKGGIFGNPAAMKADVFAEANAFAAQRGKSMVVLNAQEIPLIVGRQFASYELQFRLVEKGSQAATGATLTPVAPRTESKIEVTTPAARQDPYTELLKLDDLRKRGIISDDEFAAQKRKLLGS